MVTRKAGSAALTYLHTDHLGSTLTTTGVAGSKRYTAYGATRGTGTIPTDYGWTAQHNDGTGLIYMHARYYDPATGQFVSPDTIVSDAGNVYAYNRYLYGYGNPLKHSDPSGHSPQDPNDLDPNNAPCSTEWCWMNRWYNARGYFWDKFDWSSIANAKFHDSRALEELFEDAGISFSRTTQLIGGAQRELLGQSVAALAQRIDGIRGIPTLRSLLPGIVSIQYGNNPTLFGIGCQHGHDICRPVCQVWLVRLPCPRTQ